MELLPGLFEKEWELRRATIQHERDLTRQVSTKFEEDLRKRGGGGGGKAPALPSLARTTSGPNPKIFAEAAASDRSMTQRLEGLAKGSQPAVVKMASYGGGASLGAMMNYVSREGKISLETDAGERISNREEIAKLKDEWSPLFQHRADSRDIAAFSVEFQAGEITSEEAMHSRIREGLKSGLGNRRLAYSVHQRSHGNLEIRGVMVLRSGEGERLTGDAQAASIVQERFSKAVLPDGLMSADKFSFNGFGNGVEYGTARLRDLVSANDGDVHDERGNKIDSGEAAAHLSQRSWRQELHSRKGRDVMHVILSARAGTDVEAFERASREFLGEQFAGFRYAFAMHDPINDPKDQSEGGKRPHIHVHALVVMRNEHGERIVTDPKVFRQWRALLAEKAREQGISMEMSDRRDLASAPAFTRNQVRAVSRAGQTYHVGTSDAAQVRYDNKRSEARTISTTKSSLAYAFEAKSAWRKIADGSKDPKVIHFAQSARDSLTKAVLSSAEGLSASVDRGEFKSEYEAALHQVAEIIEESKNVRDDINRNDLDLYKANVAGALENFEKTIEPDDREEFELIKQRANNVVTARTKLVELYEEFEAMESNTRPNSIARDLVAAVAEFSPTTRLLDVVQDAVKSGVDSTEKSLKQAFDAQPEQTSPAASGKATVGDANVTARSRSLPTEITDQYFVQQANNGAVRIFTNSKASRELFQDAGEKLRSKTFEPTSVRLMLETAAHRGWTSVEISGSKEFRKEAWLEGQARGIAVKGYQPSEIDWQEVGRREQVHLKNEIRHIEEKISTAEKAPVGKDQAHAKAGSVEQSAVTSVTKSTRANFRDGVSGVFVGQGSKPYQDNPKNETSPFVVLRTEDGNRTVWGVGLPDAIVRADARPGDTITLREDGMEQVNKSIIREIDGKKVAQDELVDRRKWEAEVTARGDKTSQVETSSDRADVVQEKNTSRDSDASVTENPQTSSNRLEELVQQQKNVQERGDQER